MALRQFSSSLVTQAEKSDADKCATQRQKEKTHQGFYLEDKISTSIKIIYYLSYVYKTHKISGEIKSLNVRLHKTVAF